MPISVFISNTRDRQVRRPDCRCIDLQAVNHFAELGQLVGAVARRKRPCQFKLRHCLATHHAADGAVDGPAVGVPVVQPLHVD